MPETAYWARNGDYLAILFFEAPLLLIHLGKNGFVPLINVCCRLL
jgi:hypothetical protein